LWVSTIARRASASAMIAWLARSTRVLADQRRGAGLLAQLRHDAGEMGGLAERRVDGGLGFEKGAGDLLGDHAALLEHEFSPCARGPARACFRISGFPAVQVR
jgi:hypothetical protein